MDMKKIGGFLKKLRKEKKLTQEQLAEILSVSSRTVSRWETGTNMPDLSILIQLAEFYDVEVKEILDGERKSEIMNKELKETLSKVADYQKIEKEKTAKIEKIAFGVVFITCAIMIVLQLYMLGSLKAVAGETVVLVIGGVTYICLMIHNGLWEYGIQENNTVFRDGIISIVCGGLFSIFLMLCYLKLGTDISKAFQITLLFFIVISVTGFLVLRILTCCNQKRKQAFTVSDVRKEEIYPVNIFTADGNMQAEMIVEALKNENIMAYMQKKGDAGLAAVRYGMGRGFDDRVEIIVSSDKAEDAMGVLEGMVLHTDDKN